MFIWQKYLEAHRAPADDNAGDGGEGEQQNAGAGVAGDGGGEEKPASRFADKGLGRFRQAEGEEGDSEEEKQQQTAGDAERPEWLPEKFKSPEAMARAYADLETKLRNGGKIDPDDIVPDEGTPEAYFGDDFALDESVDRLDLSPDDPGLKVASDVFKKYGIGKKTAAAIVKDMFKGMNEHAPMPVDPEQELKALGPNGRAVIDGNLLWLEKLDREGQLSDEDAQMAIDLMATARGVRFLNKLRGMTGERSIPTGHHVPAAGGMSPKEWHRAMQKAIAAKDYDKQAELDRISAGVFGNGPASGSPILGTVD